MRNTLTLLVAGLGIAALGLAVLLVFLGRGGLLERGLTAEIALHDFALPADYSVDAAAMSDALVEQMLRRTESDVALRMMLAQDANEMLTEIAIPRLVNAGVMRNIFDAMPGIGTVIAMPGFHAMSQVTFSNRSDQTLTDVALTLPGTLRAQGAVTGSHEGDLSSVTLATLGPGESAAVTVWLALAPDQIIARGGEIRVGAQGGLRGEVRLFGALAGWTGAEFQVRPWARWAAAGFIAAVVFLSLAVVAVAVGQSLTRPRRARV